MECKNTGKDMETYHNNYYLRVHQEPKPNERFVSICIGCVWIQFSTYDDSPLYKIILVDRTD